MRKTRRTPPLPLPCPAQPQPETLDAQPETLDAQPETLVSEPVPDTETAPPETETPVIADPAVMAVAALDALKVAEACLGRLPRMSHAQRCALNSVRNARLHLESAQKC